MTPAQTRQLFSRERSKFARHFPWVRDAQLVIVDRKCIDPGFCHFRNLAYADPDSLSVVMVRRALSLPKENVVGLIRHELGHLSDERIEQARREQRADDIAEYVTGGRVNYDSRNVQTIGRGQYPRPRNLHR